MVRIKKNIKPIQDDTWCLNTQYFKCQCQEVVNRRDKASQEGGNPWKEE
jgi:hypothetical protein